MSNSWRVRVCWWTVMNAVIEHGTPLVDDPDRVGTVTKLGVDETSFQAARPGVATKYVSHRTTRALITASDPSLPDTASRSADP